MNLVCISCCLWNQLFFSYFNSLFRKYAALTLPPSSVQQTDLRSSIFVMLSQLYVCPLNLMSLSQIILSHFLKSVFHKVTLLVYIKIQRRSKFPRESIHNINVFLLFGDNFDSSFFYDSNKVINYRNGLDRNNTNASSKWMVTLGSGHHSMNNKLN